MNILPDILPFAHQILRHYIRIGDRVIDATVGNGHDTELLARCVGKQGKVYAFDIQAVALENATLRLQQLALNHQVQFIHAGHETMLDWIDTSVRAAVFNFGYLPRGDKRITTLPETSIQAVASALKLLEIGGILVAVIYHGHEIGKLEKTALMDYFSQLSTQQYRVVQYGFVNRPHCPPFLVAVEKI